MKIEKVTFLMAHTFCIQPLCEEHGIAVRVVVQCLPDRSLQGKETALFSGSCKMHKTHHPFLPKGKGQLGFLEP